MKKRNIIILVVVGAVAVGGIVFGIRRTQQSSDNTQTAYVEKVSALQAGGSYAFAQRLSGVAESQDSVDLKADSSRKVNVIYVNQGDSVNKDDPLFSYDTSDAEASIQSAQLDIEGLNNDIQALNNEIADLNIQKSSASEDMILQYTTEIQSKQMQIRQDQLDIQSRQNSIARYRQEVDQSVVKAPIQGIIKAVNANGGTDPNTGQELPLVSMAETSTIRIKGTVNEQNISQVASGMSVTVRSRTDESQTWNGTVTNVDTDPQTSGNSYYGDSSGESASKYSFYVALDNSDGLMLGQHVYVEPGTAKGKPGIWLDNSYIVQNEDGSSFVWAADGNRLVKKNVETGEYDADDNTVEIISGLDEEDEIAYPDASYEEGMTVGRMEGQE